MIASHPQVAGASRLTQILTMQVLAITEGLDYRLWPPYVPELCRSLKCQRYRYQQATCKANPKCSVCNKTRNTNVPQGLRDKGALVHQEASCLSSRVCHKEGVGSRVASGRQKTNKFCSCSQRALPPPNRKCPSKKNSSLITCKGVSITS